MFRWRLPAVSGTEVHTKLTIAHVAISNNRADGVAGCSIAVEQPLLTQPLPHLFHDLVHLPDGHGEIVLVNSSSFSTGLGKELTQSPDGFELRIILREDTSDNLVLLHEILQQVAKLL